MGLITLASLAGQIVRYTILNGQYRWYMGLFDLNREQNAATYYQGITIFISALLAGLIAWAKWRRGDRFRLPWASLAVGLLLLSMDEMCCLHEQFETLMQRSGFRLHGLLHFQWVVPGMIAVGLAGIIFARFVWHLPRAIRVRFIVACALYLGGAVGLEMVGGWYAERYDDNNLPYQLLATVEELLEMSGVAVGNVALARYLAEHVPGVALRVAGAAPLALQSVESAMPQADSSRRESRWFAAA
ncbi:MAG TPA: hypothetical protein VNL70_00410 [Tepidisphaeraceae bacterium]|nr:hypothetical protein [Tepidisphaeraceae bacterium]